jgi:hypothetical protein
LVRYLKIEIIKIGLEKLGVLIFSRIFACFDVVRFSTEIGFKRTKHHDTSRSKIFNQYNKRKIQSWPEGNKMVEAGFVIEKNRKSDSDKIQKREQTK